MTWYGVFDKPIVRHSITHRQRDPLVWTDIEKLDRSHVKQFGLADSSPPSSGCHPPRKDMVVRVVSKNSDGRQVERSARFFEI